MLLFIYALFWPETFDGESAARTESRPLSWKYVDRESAGARTLLERVRRKGILIARNHSLDVDTYCTSRAR